MGSFADAQTDATAYAVDKMADAWLYGRAFAILRIHRQMLQMNTCRVAFTGVGFADQCLPPKTR